jgi:2-polyprenyl-3-methyl-5-hydroxy-6-metoxy-1,4-benzoquinol methylase
MTAITRPDRTDQLVERLFGATLATLELFSVYLGTELGLYRTLRDRGPLTADELADAAAIAERYAHEWLEQQAVAGLIAVADSDAAAAQRRYVLGADHARVLVDLDDSAHLAPFAHMVAGIGGVLPAVAAAYRSGGGVPYAAYGQAFRHGQGHINRPAFTDDLPGAWLGAMPDVRQRLTDGGRVADIGCGQGWSALAIANAFPSTHVDGYDVDPGSIQDARRHAAAAGLSDRVRFLERDAAQIASGDRYDLILVLETLHDLPHPVQTLRAAHAALADDGAVLIADERVADSFASPGDEVERMMYGWSVSHCLPTQMAEQPSAALGTVMRAGTVRELAEDAGFACVDVLPVENDFFRLYRLHP